MEHRRLWLTSCEEEQLLPFESATHAFWPPAAQAWQCGRPRGLLLALALAPLFAGGVYLCLSIFAVLVTPLSGGGGTWVAAPAARKRGLQVVADSDCPKDGEDCRQAMCCANRRSTCFVKNAWWASCNISCASDMIWTSNGWSRTHNHTWDCQVLAPEGAEEEEEEEGATPAPSEQPEAEDVACRHLAPDACQEGSEGAEEEQDCQWNSMVECCLHVKCRGCVGRECSSCRETSRAACCETLNVSADYGKCTGLGPEITDPRYQQCKAAATTACRGCQGEQECSRCGWDGSLDCCLEQECRGCTGEHCVECRRHLAEQCCDVERVPGDYRGCRGEGDPGSREREDLQRDADLSRCKAESWDNCSGCAGEQCSYCHWDGSVNCCLASRCKNCTGEASCSSACHNEQAAACCAEESVPGWYGRCAPEYPFEPEKDVAYVECKAQAARSCEGCTMRDANCTHCDWDGRIHCCLNKTERCQSSAEGQCGGCEARHVVECCEEEAVPASYWRCAVEAPTPEAVYEECKNETRQRDCDGCQDEECFRCARRGLLHCCLRSQCVNSADCDACRQERFAGCCAQEGSCG